MEDKDFIFMDEEHRTDYPGEFSEGDKVIINNEDYLITSFVKYKDIKDKMGFPATYTWYKAEDQNGEPVNLFFFDGDIDCKEKNDKIAEKWFEDYMKDSN